MPLMSPFLNPLQYKDFFARYGIEVDAALEPADTVRARLYREFRKGTMTVIEIRKVKNMLTQSGPKPGPRLVVGWQLQAVRP